MSRIHVLAAVLALGGLSACCHCDRPSKTTITSVPISSDMGDARLVTTPSPETTGPARQAALAPPDDASIPYTPSTGATSGAPTPTSGSVSRPRRAPLVSPGLDNTVTGGVANAGAPFNCGYGNNGNIVWE
jgi:hypothetical protein